MKKAIYLFTILITAILFACSSSKNEISAFKWKSLAELPPYEEYISLVKEKLKQVTVEEKKSLFFHCMTEDMPNYWCGTKWDFNGVTRIPQNATIACGYFVTTLLEDFGFDIQRIYLAQQASSVMIQQLCAKNSVHHFSSVEKVQAFMLERSEQEIYIVGLDFHTGFLIRNGEKIYFFHSNYIDKSGVVLEEIHTSEALKSSQTFMVGSLSENTSLFK